MDVEGGEVEPLGDPDCGFDVHAVGDVVAGSAWWTGEGDGIFVDSRAHPQLLMVMDLGIYPDALGWSRREFDMNLPMGSHWSVS